MEYEVRPTCILAVDDDAFNLDLVEMTFAGDELIHVARAANGQLAMDMIDPNETDVILLDLQMPVMNGFEVLSKIRSNHIYHHIPVIVVTANHEEKHQALELGANDFISKPVDIRELKLRTMNHAKIKAFHDFLQASNVILESKISDRTKELNEALDLARSSEREIVFLLGRAAEYRDIETGAHIKRVRHYSALLAQMMNLPKSDVDMVSIASTLHDVGKVGIPDAILLKQGKLTPNEYDIMKMHVNIGVKMLQGDSRYPLLSCSRIIASQHHEKFDGSGYPAGLAGDNIHIFGRIVSVADVFDALSSDRPYKNALPVDKVMDIMKRERGKHFDPVLLDLLVENLPDFLEIKNRYQEEKQPVDQTPDNSRESVLQ